MTVREDSVKPSVKGTSTCSFLESVKLREGSVKATVKLKGLQELFLCFAKVSQDPLCVKLAQKKFLRSHEDPVEVP